MVKRDLPKLIADVNCRPAATETMIVETEKQLGLKLPEGYLSFLEIANGGEGFVGKAYVILWAVEELPSMNAGYEVQTYAPGLLMFGSDGGGEAYGFDTRAAQWPVVQVPFIGMNWSEARAAGESFEVFMERLYDGEDLEV